MFKKLTLAAVAALFLFAYPFKAASNQDVAQYLMLEKASQVVMLTPPSRHNTGGTGFELRTPNGNVVTVSNAHVCRLGESGTMSAKIPGQDRWVNLRILEISKTTDLCVMERLPGASGLTLASEIVPYSHVYALGHPHLEPLRVSEGNLLARETIQIAEEIADTAECEARGGTPKSMDGFFGPVLVCVDSVDSFPITAQIYPGNSGSPLMNANGEVIGVVFASDRRTNQGFTIPLDVLTSFVSFY